VEIEVEGRSIKSFEIETPEEADSLKIGYSASDVLVVIKGLWSLHSSLPLRDFIDLSSLDIDIRTTTSCVVFPAPSRSLVYDS
jgi:hypothetical protein